MISVHIPPVFRYPEAIAYWIVYIWAFIPEFRILKDAASEIDRDQDSGTMRLILRTNQISMLLAFALAFLPWLQLPYPRVAIVAGTALLLSGGILRRVCFRMLGDYFTGAVIVDEGHPVIEKGPYRFVRHPSYTAGIILLIGIGIGLGSAVSVLVLFILPSWAYAHRVRAEEKALLETIGDPYRDYMTRTKRFIPFVF